MLFWGNSALESGRVQALRHLISANMEDLNKLMAYCGSDLPDFRRLFDMMKDNGDGTVTVRFYDENTPVFVTVKKCVPTDRALSHVPPE